MQYQIKGFFFRVEEISDSEIILKRADGRLLKISVNPDDGMGYGTDGSYNENACLKWEWVTNE